MVKIKIAFASKENAGLDGRLSHHFGRCPYYVFVEVEDSEVKNVEVKENPYFASHVPGAVPQFIASEGANVIIAGGMGPRAIDWFTRLGIQPVTGASGKIRDILNDYLAGKIQLGAEPCGERREVEYRI